MKPQFKKPFKKFVPPPPPHIKRWNRKRKCAFCKVVFRSQRSYNGHVNSCKEGKR